MTITIPTIDETKRMDYLGNYLALRGIGVNEAILNQLPDINDFTVVSVNRGSMSIKFYNFETGQSISLKQHGNTATLRLLA